MPKILFNKANLEKVRRSRTKAQETYIDDLVPNFLVVVGTQHVSFFVRLGTGRLFLGRWPELAADQARHAAMNAKARHKAGEDLFTEPPKQQNTAVPNLRAAFEEYLRKNKRRPRTDELYRYEIERYLDKWLEKPLDEIDRRMVEKRFREITDDNGWSVGNRVFSLLRSIYKAPCVDLHTLRNPVQDWLDGGGRFNPKKRRNAALHDLRSLVQAFDTVIENDVLRDMMYMLLYTGMRRSEAASLAWDDVSFDHGTYTAPVTKNGRPLILPMTRQTRTILERRHRERINGWVFGSPTSESGHIEDCHHLYPKISNASGQHFYAHALRNTFIHIGFKVLGIDLYLIKRLVNHVTSADVTLGYADDWGTEALRDAAQQIADRIDEDAGIGLALLTDCRGQEAA